MFLLMRVFSCNNLKSNYLLSSLSLLASCQLTGSGAAPAPTYQLTAAELAWQGYKSGQELRFGRAGSARVRTYQVLQVKDDLQTQWRPSGWLPVPQSEPLYQHVTVTGWRTDSLLYRKSVSSNDSALVKDVWLDLYKYETRDGEIQTRADIAWSYWFTSYLPVETLATSQFTASATMDLLPSIQLGASTYSQVVRITHLAAAIAPARTIWRLYYARELGVVAYEEVGTGLWYRLP